MSMMVSQLLLACAALLPVCCAPAAADATGPKKPPPHKAPTLRLSPRPQLQEQGSGVFVLDYNSFIAVDMTNTSHVFAAEQLQTLVANATGVGVGRLPIVPLRAGFRTGLGIVIGCLSDPVIAAQASKRNLSGSIPQSGDAASHFAREGYVLDIAGGNGGIILAGATPAGAYYGVQTLAQIINATYLSARTPPQPNTVVELAAARTTDWPSFRVRGMHVHELNKLMTDVTMNFYLQADRMSYHKMNFFSAMTTSDVTFDIAGSGQMELEMQAYCSRRHMTYVPCLGLGQTLPQDPRTSEGIWARDVGFTVQPDGKLRPDTAPFLPLRNAGFEDGPVTNGVPSGWSVVGGGNGTGTWTLDSATSSSPGGGGRSMRCDVPTGVALSSRLLSEPVAAVGGRTYQLSLFSKVSNTTDTHHWVPPWIWLVQLDKAGAEIKHLPTGVQLASNKYQNAKAWIQGTCTFNAEPEAVAFQVYAGQTNAAGGAATFWIDDLAILSLDHALSNVIRTGITDLVVRPAGQPRNSSAVFKPSQHYTITPAPKNVSGAGSFRASANTSELDPGLLTIVTATSGTPAGGLRPGMKLWVDYDFQPGSMGFHTYDVWAGADNPKFPWPPSQHRRLREQAGGQSQSRSRERSRAQSAGKLGSPHTDFGGGFQSADFEEPLYYQYAISSAVKLLDFFARYGEPLKYINLDYDELQTVARDSRSLRSGKTNGELLAGSINRILDGIRAAGHTEVVPLFWDDMLNPYHLHGATSDQDNLQAQHYAREDKTLDTAMSLVTHKDIVWLNWFYDWPYSNYRINQSLPMEWGQGFNTIGCPNTDFQNIQCYAEALSHNPARGLGMMDTDWDGRYLGTIRTAEVAWNFRHNASLECDRACDPHPCVPPAPAPGV